MSGGHCWLPAALQLCLRGAGLVYMWQPSQRTRAEAARPRLTSHMPSLLPHSVAQSESQGQPRPGDRESDNTLQ